MPRAIPILVIIGLAIYSFFDVLQTTDGAFRRYSKMAWLLIVLVPVAGAAAWFLAGRPQRSRGGYGPPRVISLRSHDKPVAPDDDPAFLRRLEEEAWRRKRDQRRREADGPTASPGPDAPGTAADAAGPDAPGGSPPPRSDGTPPRRPNDGPAPSGPPGIAPAG